MYEFEATADVLVMTGQGKAAIDRRDVAVAARPAAFGAESTESILVSAVLAGNRDMFGAVV